MHEYRREFSGWIQLQHGMALITATLLQL